MQDLDGKQLPVLDITPAPLVETTPVQDNSDTSKTKGITRTNSTKVSYEYFDMVTTVSYVLIVQVYLCRVNYVCVSVYLSDSCVYQMLFLQVSLSVFRSDNVLYVSCQSYLHLLMVWLQERHWSLFGRKSRGEGDDDDKKKKEFKRKGDCVQCLST